MERVLRGLPGQEGYLQRLSHLVEIDVVLAGQPADRLIEDRIVGPDLLLDFRDGLFPFRLQAAVDLARRFPYCIILFLHDIPFPKN